MTNTVAPQSTIKPSLEGRTDRLPVITYGTLRRGQHNYGRFLAGSTVRETVVTVLGMEMHGLTGFPYVFEADSPESTIVAELVELEESSYESTVRGLDFLEGYKGPDATRNHYDRIVVTVNDGEKDVEAYIYVGNPEIKESVEALEMRIADGDWVAHSHRRFRQFGSHA